MNAPQGSEPVFNLPGVVVASLAVLAGLHAVQVWLPDAEAVRWTLGWGVVPARTLVWLGLSAESAVLEAALREGGRGGVVLARHVLGEGGSGGAALLTHALLHVSWAHVGFNALWLAAFGAPVARRLGPARFLGLAALGAAGGALAHIAAEPLSVLPMVGASTAVSALMGAATLFVFTPAPGAVPVHARPRQALADLVRNRSAATFAVVWFVTTLLVGLVPAALPGAEGPIAWQAHLGGFLAGCLAFPLLDPSGRMGAAAGSGGAGPA